MKRIVYSAVILISVLSSCSGRNDILNSVFDQTEMNAVNVVLNWYDTFIIINTENRKNSEFEKRYPEFFENNIRIASMMDEMNALRPPYSNQVSILGNVDEEALNSIFDIDSEGNFTINKSGKFPVLLKRLSRGNRFYKSFYNYVLETEDPYEISYIATINFENFDYTKTAERFVMATSMMVRPNQPNNHFGPKNK